jgi:putative peptidoglycan lipid II flippase
MIGLVFYSGIKVLQPAFFSIDKRFVPMVITIVTIFTNVTLNSISVFVLGWDHTALAWCTAFNLALNFSVLYFLMSRLADGLETGPLLATLGRLAIALAAMAAVCVLAQRTLLAEWDQLRLFVQIAGLGGTVLVAALVYLVVSARLGVEETREFVALLARRWGGRGGRA